MAKRAPTVLEDAPLMMPVGLGDEVVTGTLVVLLTALGVEEGRAWVIVEIGTGDLVVTGTLVDVVPAFGVEEGRAWVFVEVEGNGTISLQ